MTTLQNKGASVSRMSLLLTLIYCITDAFQQYSKVAASITTTATTVSSNDSAVRFLILGDWGKSSDGGSGGPDSGPEGGGGHGPEGGGGPHKLLPVLPVQQHSSTSSSSKITVQKEASYQENVAAAMGAYAAETRPQFLITVGDNFYDDGVSSTTDSLWSSLWSNVYLDPYPYLKVPWYPVLGNHDYGGGFSYARAQVARTTQNVSGIDDDYWQMPATNYSKYFSPTSTYLSSSSSSSSSSSLSSGDDDDDDGSDDGDDNDDGQQQQQSSTNEGSVVIVFIDTTTLAPSLNRCCNEEGGVSTDTQAELIANQLSHITQMLDEAIAQQPSWLLVVGHYPVYSQGEHLDSSELVSYLQPLLKSYNVHAYFSGHDHISEHLTHKSGTEHFVVGAGSMTGTLTDTSKGTSAAKFKWAGPSYCAFGSVQATATELTMKYINTSQQVTYSYTLTNPFSWGPSAPPSRKPSLQPTSTSSPTFVPTVCPTLLPSAAPTQLIDTHSMKGVVNLLQHLGSASLEQQLLLGLILFMLITLLVGCMYLCCCFNRQQEDEEENSSKHGLLLQSTSTSSAPLPINHSAIAGRNNIGNSDGSDARKSPRFSTQDKTGSSLTTTAAATAAVATSTSTSTSTSASQRPPMPPSPRHRQAADEQSHQTGEREDSSVNSRTSGHSKKSRSTGSNSVKSTLSRVSSRSRHRGAQKEEQQQMQHLLGVSADAQNGSKAENEDVDIETGGYNATV